MTAPPRFLLLGEAPNDATAHRPQLWLLPDQSGEGHTGNRLFGWFGRAGWTMEAFLATFERDNLLRAPQPASRGRGREFDQDAADLEAQRIRVQLQAGGLAGVLVLGTRASRSFAWFGRGWPSEPELELPPPLEWRSACCLDDAPLLARGDLEPFRAAWLPHPSGTNVWWNRAKNADAAVRFLELLRLELGGRNGESKMAKKQRDPTGEQDDGPDDGKVPMGGIAPGVPMADADAPEAFVPIGRAGTARAAPPTFMHEQRGRDQEQTAADALDGGLESMLERADEITKGLRFACVARELGAKVSVLELVAGAAAELAAQAKQVLRAGGGLVGSNGARR